MIGGNRNITINEQDFSRKLTEISCELTDSLTDAIKFASFCARLHEKIFDEPDETDKTDDELPFHVGDEVFVIDDKGDGNNFVNQVVTVTKVVTRGYCEVTNEETTQDIWFENLRKVETP